MTAPLFTLLAAWAISVASPGPDFIAVLRNSAAGGRRQGLMISVGVVSGIAVWATLAMVGLSAVMARYEHLYLGVRYVGAAFLFCYGVRIAWGAIHPKTSTDERAIAPVRSNFASWRLGLITNLANPKPLVFFGALFATLLPHGLSGAGKAAVLLTMLMMAMVWFAFVTVIASSGPFVGVYRRLERRIETVLGVAFAGLGAALVAEH